jgi:uncharacterized membrane protein YkoI
MRTVARLIAALAVAAAPGHVFAGSGPVDHYKGDQLASKAHVTLKVARRIALQSRPGIIIGQELEREAGGSGLRYSFDIKSGPKVYEVGVDARSGRVLENAAEGLHPD